VIVPALDTTGLVNVAVDIGRGALAAGHDVSLLHLGGPVTRTDLGAFPDVRRFRPSDLPGLSGIVHTHGLRPDLLGWMISWNPRCRLVTTIHGHFPLHLSFDYAPWKVQWAWAAWSRAIARFDRRVCISSTMQRHYARMLPGLSFDVAYNFRSVDPAPPPALPLSLDPWIDRQRGAGRLVLAYVGALSNRKNVQALFEALQGAPELSLVTCGEGALQPWCASRLADDPEFAARVLMLGQLPGPDRVVARCDMLVMPSHAEGMPLAVLEAARVMRPSLMSNIAVHRELAGLGMGEVFERHRFRDFVQKARRLASRTPDPALGALWEERFSEGRGFQRYADIFARDD
jgi:glycosyltransferase involved in cell wall biosynthesis